MATFHVQIEGLTSIALTSDSSPTEDEVTQYLRDGVREVASRIIVIKPQETFRFCDTNYVVFDDSLNRNIRFFNKIAQLRSKKSISVESHSVGEWQNLRKFVDEIYE